MLRNVFSSKYNDLYNAEIEEQLIRVNELLRQIKSRLNAPNIEPHEKPELEKINASLRNVSGRLNKLATENWYAPRALRLEKKNYYVSLIPAVVGVCLLFYLFLSVMPLRKELEDLKMAKLKVDTVIANHESKYNRLQEQYFNSMDSVRITQSRDTKISAPNPIDRGTAKNNASIPKEVKNLVNRNIEDFNYLTEKFKDYLNPEPVGRARPDYNLIDSINARNIVLKYIFQ